MPIEPLLQQLNRRIGGVQGFQTGCPCGVSGPFAPTKEEAIAAWDTLPRAVVCQKCNGRVLEQLWYEDNGDCEYCHNKGWVLACIF